MATETLPKHGALHYDNYITRAASAVVTKTSERAAFPATNLLTSMRSETWRTAATTTSQMVVVNLGFNALPTFFALVNSNIISGVNVTLRCAADSGMLTNVLVWTLPTYLQNARSIMRWYLGAPDSGAPTYPSGVTGRTFWQLELPANSTFTTYHEVGVWWLGQYVDFPIDLGLQRSVSDPSVSFVSEAQAPYVDRRPTYQVLDGSTSYLPDAEAAIIEAALETRGIANQCILDLWPPRTDAIAKARSAYYGVLGTGDVLGIEHELETRNNLSWTFTETRG